jgi:hypothetical protein
MIDGLDGFASHRLIYDNAPARSLAHEETRMNRRHFLTSIAAAASAPLLTRRSLFAAEPATKTPPEAPVPPNIPDFAKQVPSIKSGDPVFTFNGKDFDGWYTFLRDHKHEDPDHVFSINAEGQLHISGQEFGGITTEKNYGNYHLVTEWKWGEKTWELLTPKSLARPKGCSRDAGILVHGVGPDGAAYGNWLESIEAQIIEGGVGDFLVVSGEKAPSLTVEVRPGEAKQVYFAPGGKPMTKRGGRFNWWGRDPAWTDTLGFRDKFNVEKRHGEWNRHEVICDGDAITTILNGYLVNHGTKSNRTEGKIQIQSEGAEIIFRKIEVRPLIQ